MKIIVKAPGENTREVLLKHINDSVSAYDVFVCGYHGRKGAKANTEQLGHTAEATLRGAFCSCLVVKQKYTASSASWAVGVDGSEGALFAVRNTAQCVRPGDKFVILYMDDEVARAELPASMQADAVLGRVRTMMADVECAVEPEYVVVNVGRDDDQPIADALVDWLEEHDVEIAVVGADGVGALLRGEHETGKLGSVSSRVVRRARCNVLVSQDRHAIHMA